jgi:predicted nucleic acid-binding protein
MLRAPDWLTIHPFPELGEDRSLDFLDAGERAAILLAIALRGDLLLIDERAGAATARAGGLAVTGTIGVLDLAARAGLTSLREVFPRLQRTNFRYAPSLLEQLLEEEELRKKAAE